jgi:DNA-binding MarR family transcriptional regulator
LVRRTRNPENERQVIVALTDAGRALRFKAGCLAEALLAASDHSPSELGDLNQKVRRLRDSIYRGIGGWHASAA